MILTKSNTLKSAYKLLNQLILEGKGEEFLLIVPTNRKLRLAKKEIISKSPNQSISKINIETLSTISVKILEGCVGRLNILSESAASVLLNNSFRAINLKYFSSYKNGIPKGTLDRIKNVFHEYKRHGITPEILADETVSLSGSARRKAEDISAVFYSYQELLKKLNAYEIGDVYRHLINLNLNDFGKTFDDLYNKVKLVVVEGFSEFSKPEIDILDKISDRVNGNLFLNFDYSEDNDALFSHLAETYQKLKNKNFKYFSEEGAESEAFIKIIREKLFKPTEIKIVQNNICEITAKTPEEEITFVVKEIKNLIVNEGAKPHNICVAFNLIEKYSTIVRDKFQSFGIPLNLTDRYALNTFQPVVTIINLLEIEESDFYYKNVLRALSSDYFKPKYTTLYDLMNAVSELKIIAGYSSWNMFIKSHLRNYNDDDSALKVKSIYENILKEIDSINKLLIPFKKKLTLDQFYEELEKLVFHLNIPQKILTSGSGYEEENLKAITSLLQTAKELFELLKLDQSETETHSINYYLQQLRTAIESARFNVKEKSNFGVLVTTLKEIRGLKFDHLFLCGLVDGDFPTRYTPEIIQSKLYQRYEKKHQTEEQNLFYLSLSCWKKSLYLFHPLTNGNSELVPSNFLTAIKNIFDIKFRSENDYSNLIFSRNEYLMKFGEDIALNREIELPVGIENNPIAEELINKITIQQEYRKDIAVSNEFQGQIKVEGSLQSVLENLKNKSYSITQLETYAHCPFKCFAERILYLKPQSEPKEEIEALELGSLLHEILYEFYKEVKNKNTVISNCSNEEFAYLLELIFTIAKEKINDANFESPLSFFEKEKILGINDNRKYSILYLYLEQERNTQDGFLPLFFEETFGRRGESIDSDIDDVRTPEGNKLFGKIDRIDLNERNSTIKVIDYKRGTKKSGLKEDIYRGLSLQLPVYLYAAKLIVERKLNLTTDPAIASIYSLKPGDSFGNDELKLYNGRKGFNDSSDEEQKIILQKNREVMKDSLNKIDEYISSISDGKFHLSILEDKAEKVCSYCDFKGVCRINELVSD
jgi:ATP-dependent helicase/nuclease subunit B